VSASGARRRPGAASRYHPPGGHPPQNDRRDTGTPVRSTGTVIEQNCSTEELARKTTLTSPSGLGSGTGGLVSEVRVEDLDYANESELARNDSQTTTKCAWSPARRRTTMDALCLPHPSPAVAPGGPARPRGGRPEANRPDRPLPVPASRRRASGRAHPRFPASVEDRLPQSGVSGKYRHDFRRTAVRNMVNAGVP